MLTVITHIKILLSCLKQYVSLQSKATGYQIIYAPPMIKIIQAMKEQ